MSTVKSANALARKRLAPTPRKNKDETSFLGPRKTQKSTDHMAQYLAETFSSPEHVPAFNKIAWRLDDGTIHRLVASAKELGKRSPRGYFIACARNEMKRRGVL